MGRMYTAVMKAQAITDVQDFISIQSGTGKTLTVHGWVLTQSTEVGDAAEEMLQLSTNRGVGSVTITGGTSVTATKLNESDAAISATIKRNHTTVMAVGTGTLYNDLELHTWNVRVPYLMFYPPELRPVIRSTDYWTLELETAPADSVTVNLTVWLEENG